MPPHVTLVYPFAGELTDGIVLRLAGVLGSFPAFDLTLAETHRLGWAGDTVLSLRPYPSEPFVAMTEAVVAAFPEYPPYEGVFDEIIPHLTAAMSTDLALLDRLDVQIAGGLPVHARVEAAGLFQPTADGWRLHTRLELERHEDVVDVLAVEEELLPLDTLDDETGRLVEPPRGLVRGEDPQGQPTRAAPPSLEDRRIDEGAPDSQSP
jgi:hypothetical protein